MTVMMVRMAATTYLHGPGMMPSTLLTSLYKVYERGNVFFFHFLDGEIKALIGKPPA